MRFANREGRFVLATDTGYVDVATASGGRFGPDPLDALEHWVELRDWTAGAVERAGEHDAAEPGDDPAGGSLRAPVPNPRQVFGIGLNYSDHVAESGFTPPASPAVFTKFPTSVTGPHDTVVLPPGSVDWEVELVVVIGVRCESVTEDDAWSHVAGVTVGQDLSERQLQLAGPAPQFSLGKSFPGFAPIVPELVTVDELPNPNDLALGCALEGGETLQDGRTSNLIFSVPALIARLSAVCPLLPGDLIFTGTPAGVGGARTPPKFLTPGDVLVSWIEGVGSLRNPMVASPALVASGSPAAAPAAT